MIFKFSLLMIVFMLALMIVTTVGVPKLLERFCNYESLVGTIFNDLESSGIAIVAVSTLVAIPILAVVSIINLNAVIFNSLIIAFNLWVIMLAIYFCFYEKLKCNTY